MARRQKGPTDKRKIEFAEKQRQALQLRKAGADYNAIARALGYANRSGAWKAVQVAIADLPREDAKDVLKLELERMDDDERVAVDLIHGNRKEGAGGDPKRAAIVLGALRERNRIRERRARLLGLDKPIEITGAGGGPLTMATSTVPLSELLEIARANEGRENEK